MRRQRSSQKTAPVSALLLATLLVGCTAHLIADYDPYLDQHAADLGTRVDAFITKMENSAGTPAGTFASNQAFYAETHAELVTLRLRGQTATNSELIVKSIDLIGENVGFLASLHKAAGDGGLSEAMAEPARTALQTQFESFYKLEAALRRGQ